jgi:hypothetical protein
LLVALIPLRVLGFQPDKFILFFALLPAGAISPDYEKVRRVSNGQTPAAYSFIDERDRKRLS